MHLQPQVTSVNSHSTEKSFPLLHLISKPTPLLLPWLENMCKRNGTKTNKCKRKNNLNTKILPNVQLYFLKILNHYKSNIYVFYIAIDISNSANLYQIPIDILKHSLDVFFPFHLMVLQILKVNKEEYTGADQLFQFSGVGDRVKTLQFSSLECSHFQ